MKKSCFKLFFWGIILFSNNSLQSQTLPVGTPVLEDYYRRLQLLGKVDSNISFTVRPLSTEALKMENVFAPDTSNSQERRTPIITRFANGKGKFQLLPIALQTQYNSKLPYGWNDGPMIPARGLQAVLSAGVYAKLGPLSIQLRPEFVYAENDDFINYREDSDAYPNLSDTPIKFGNGVYKKPYLGQSSIRLSFGAISFGLSSENLWFGPGMKNSLLMSNSAPGFNHITLNTSHPVTTPIGSFEAQVIGGRLEGSDDIENPNKWRYLSTAVLAYQPKWLSGLCLGVIRSFQVYGSSIDNISDYIPIFQSFESKNNARDLIPRDQLTSIYARWLWLPAQMELYFEYGRGDHSATSRDLTLEPEHSRAYLFGVQKMIDLSMLDQHLVLAAEVTHTQQSINYIIRSAGSWYKHAQLVEGYTHRGEILGAGIGPGANLQSIDIKWLRGFQSIGFQLERLVYNNDYYPPTDKRLNNYKDISATVNYSFSYKKFSIYAALKKIRSSRFSNPAILNTRPNSLNDNNLQINMGAFYCF